MLRWRQAREAGTSLSPEETSELEELRVAELEATILRATAMLDEAFQARRADLR